MQTTYSILPIERVAYFSRGTDRPAEVYLHENIERVPIDEDGTVGYRADEIFFTTTLSKEEVEVNFDALWVAAETKSKSIGERIEEIESLLGIVIDEVLGV